MEDARIVKLFWARDERAIAVFEKQYKNLCFSVAFSILEDYGKAEECVSDVCFRLWKKGCMFDLQRILRQLIF